MKIFNMEVNNKIIKKKQNNIAIPETTEKTVLRDFNQSYCLKKHRTEITKEPIIK